MRIFNPFAAEELGKATPACPGLTGSTWITCFDAAALVPAVRPAVVFIRSSDTQH